MDKENIKEELEDLIGEFMWIYFASNMEYNRDVLKEPDKALQDVLKQPLPDMSVEELRKNLGIALKNFPEEKVPKLLEMTTQEILKKSVKKIKHPKEEYYAWYDRAYEVVRILRPRKLKEFERLYYGNQNVENDVNLNVMMAGTKNYIQGWVFQKNNQTIDFFYTFLINFMAQQNILSAIYQNFDNPLFNLERDIHLEIYKSEMDIAKDLEKQGNLRTAGAIASVILEVHLKKLAVKHGIKDKETNSIADYNSFLKGKGVYDNILADQIKPCRKIRNKCVHTNQEDPTAGEVSSIIHIADRLTNEYN